MTVHESRPALDELAATGQPPGTTKPQNEYNGPRVKIWPPDDEGAESAVEDNPRLARRRNIKRDLARLQILEQRAAVLQQRLTEYDREADAAADLHRATCEPLQAELEALESKAVDAIVERRPVDPESESRRAEVVRLVEDANSTLDESVQKIERLRKALEEELKTARKESAGKQGLETLLTHQGIGNPELLEQLSAARTAVNLFRQQAAAANGRLRDLETSLQVAKERDRAADVQRLERAVRRARGTADAANKALAEAAARLSEVHQAAIDE